MATRIAERGPYDKADPGAATHPEGPQVILDASTIVVAEQRAQDRQFGAGSANAGPDYPSRGDSLVRAWAPVS